MFKRLLKLILILAIIVLLGYAGGNYLLNRYAPQITAHYKKVLASKGIDVEKFEHGKISLEFPAALEVQDVRLDFSLNKKLFLDKAFDAKFDAANVQFRMVSILHPAFNFSLDNFNLYFQSKDGQDDSRPFGQFEHANFINHNPIIIKDPEESVKDVMLRINRLFRENKTGARFDFDADVTLNLNGKSARVHLFTVQEDGMTSLKFDIQDVVKAAKIFDVDMVDAEAKLAADYPMRVPQMVKITQEAQRISKAANRHDPSVPEDAYRHVYWSYHLSKEFGPAFAEQITNARETEPGNTKQERQMDYNNNAVGREYAQKNLPPGEILQKVLHAPEVIRQPSEVKLPN